jgi:hypothetical protein
LSYSSSGVEETKLHTVIKVIRIPKSVMYVSHVIMQRDIQTLYIVVQKIAVDARRRATEEAVQCIALRIIV